MGGRLYRWRLGPRADRLDEYVDRAHPLLEVEFWDGATWRAVRNHTRRDDIWCQIRRDSNA
jgi:hypothetical protein